MRRGNCYVTCEALYHLLGGAAAGLTPHTVRHEDDVHWYLVKRTVVGLHEVRSGKHTTYATTWRENIIDPTASQFKTHPPYEFGRGRGFLTKGPSKRARELMDRMLWQEHSGRSVSSDRRRRTP